MHLTDGQIREYAERGYLVLHDVFSPSELALLQREADFICSSARPLQDANAWEKLPGLSTEDVKKMGVAMLAAAVERDSRVFDHTLRLPRVMTPVRQLLGDRVYLYQSRIASKRGVRPGMTRGGDPYLWHQDFAQWHLDGVMRGDVGDMVTAAIMLDASTRENGCLRFVEGSHRRGFIDYEFRTGGTAYAARYATDDAMGQLLHQHEVVDIVGPAGTVVLFCGMLMHASERNRSSNDRRMLYFIYNRMDNMPVEDPGFEKRVPNNPYVLNQNPEEIADIADDALTAEAA